MVSIGVYSFNYRDGEGPPALKPYTSLDEENAIGSKSTEKQLVVDIKGAVNNPGVYRLAPGARVYQVIEQAGGTTKGADTTKLNLAQPVVDGSMLYIPTQGEIQSSNAESGKVNVNTATVAELGKLHGIGPAKAAAILAYRTKHGPFKDTSALKKVKGIGPKILESLQNQIAF